MTEMSEKESEPDDAATHTAPGTVSVLQESKVTREARGLDPSVSEAPPGRAPGSGLGRRHGFGGPGVTASGQV